MFTPTIDSVIKGVVPGPKILDLKYKQKNPSNLLVLEVFLDFLSRAEPLLN